MANRMSTELRPSPQGVHVGIVGASGLVGGIILSILAERQFPVASLRLFASARSAGRYLRWKHTEILVEDASTADYSGLDIAFFSAGASTSLKLAPVVAATGAVVVDNSSAWRMFRSLSPKSTRTHSRRFKGESWQIRIAQRWRQCRCSSHCMRPPACSEWWLARIRLYRAEVLLAYASWRPKCGTRESTPRPFGATELPSNFHR